MTTQGSARNVLVVGSGGREHALAWKLSRSPLVNRVFLAPGNGGTSEWNIPVLSTDIEALGKFAKEKECLTLVGPELPLSLGIADHFKEVGLEIFAPTREQARLETSKSFAKEFMAQNGIPTAPFKVFSESAPALDYARELEGRLVVKADGLAGGKGVSVCSTFSEAERAIRSILDEKLFPSSNSVVLERVLEGHEASVFAICNGKSALPFGSATDHKRLLDGDRGPNTGGMGSFSPSVDLDEELEQTIFKEVVEPAVRKIGFCGFLYAGLMLTDESGPQVLEFNARLGDPETQSLLPRLETDLFPLIENSLDGGFPKDAIRWSDDYACCVVMCSAGYPGQVETGKTISGLENVSKDTLVFHSATQKSKQGTLSTSGGRVLGVTSLGPTLDRASARAYEQVSKINWAGEHHRKDIGQRLKSGAGIHFTK